MRFLFSTSVMKKLLLSILLFTSSNLFSQNSGSVVLDWMPNSKLSYNTFVLKIPQIKSSGFNFDIGKKAIFFNLRLPSTGLVSENSLRIINVVYETISISELGDLSLKDIPTALNPKLQNIKSRNNSFIEISIAPIIKQGNIYQKVKSFDYNYSINNTNRTPTTINSISNSVLSSGDWYRFYVQKSGVYVITKSFLTQLGINTSGIDPRKIKIFGNGGRMLPLLNSVPYPDDLTENAIQVIGESDGVFDTNDYILFYAEGVDNWNEESETNGNLYSDKSYYYITYGGDDGKRMSNIVEPSGAATTNITTFDDTQFHEVDKINIGHLGRQWYGENFDFEAVQNFDFSIPNVVVGSQITPIIHVAANAANATSFNVKANNIDIGTINLASISTGIIFTENYLSATTFPAADNVTIKLTYNNNGVPISIGYLDYILLKSTRNLKGYGKQFRFQYNLSSSTLGIASYNISNANSISQVWDITDIYNVSKILNINQSIFSFKSNLGSLKNYIVVDQNDFYIPIIDSQTKRIGNQNLKGTIFNNTQGQFQDIDYLIITPYSLSAQAQKLANFDSNYYNLNTKVVTLESIYAEFGGGKQDIGAIRNFVKYVYNNASTPDKKVKYLNLFGDASFDFKDRIANNTNVVPIYHAMNSNTLGESSFASDDYFGMMDGIVGTSPSEGNVESYYGNLDIAVGRMIVDNAQQADEMVNKVIQYYDLKSYGSWRNNYVFIADDNDNGGDGDLQARQNALADVLWAQKPFINIDKIILDSYVQVASAGGFRYPQARTDIFNAFEKGALVFNYLGHGGEDGLAQERIWEKSDGQTLANTYKYPLFITITCDFSRFDDPTRPTAGEYTYWNPKGGAISMVTTIREIGKGGAEDFNDALSGNIFPNGSDQYTTVSEALRLTKNTHAGGRNVIFYLGDPALMLAIPRPKVVLTKVNDMPITGPIDDFKSLAYVKLTGEVQDENNILLTTYNGDLSVQIFDKNIPRVTLDNDHNGTTMNFITLGETIFRGNASVTNGQFEFGFVVPRDIRIPLGNGRISFYGKRNQLLLDKTGYNTTIKVGGVNTNAAVDTTPPKVRLYMNDESFVNGGITNESPIFLAFLEDENGINTASGIGHDILAYLDGNETSPYIMNDYYETELNNYKKGEVKFPFRGLAKGLHTLTFKAWDVYNNLVTAELQFVVVGDETLTLTNVLNYPNPFVNYTQFWFTHNRPFEPLEVQVQVMTITGRIVWSHNQIITTDGFLSREITWDGKDDFGDKIGKGVYVYKLTVKSTITNTKTEKYEKLVIL